MQQLLSYKKSKIYIQSGVPSIDYLKIPDTIGTCKAPLSAHLSLGNYDIIINKKGYKITLIKDIALRESKKNISIDMVLEIGEVTVTVNPQEARDATVTFIQKSKWKFNQILSLHIRLFLILSAMWKAPLSTYLFLGNYDIILNKEGFKDVLKKIVINKSQNNISIDMLSLAYLQAKRDQWRTYKWISAAVAVGAGVASYYFKDRIDTYADEYKKAISPAVALDKRRNVVMNQSFYKISSAITFISIGCFTVSWIIESTYY